MPDIRNEIAADEPAFAFGPEHVGPMVNVADLPRDQQEAIVGKPLADFLAEKKDEPFVPGHYEITNCVAYDNR